MRPVVEISVSFILQMLHYLSSLGVNPEIFPDEAGINSVETDSPDKRVPIQNFYRIQENAIKITKDETFGLHLGEFTEAGSWSILGYIIMNCSTLSAALERICRYQTVIGNFIQINMTVSKNEATLTFEITMPDSKNIRHCYEAAVSSLVKMIRDITGKEIQFNKITFQHEAADNISEYSRILGCLALFNQKATTIVFSKETLESPITLHNPTLLELFEQHAKQHINLVNSDNYYTGKVTNLILNWLSEGTPGINRIARELSLSVRSLQKKLSEEGITFRKLLENIRKELSASYLKEKHFSIDDISYLLGFSEPSIFRKAFKKWTGITPGDYRNHSDGKGYVL